MDGNSVHETLFQHCEIHGPWKNGFMPSVGANMVI